ncbi:cyclopropane fatty acyl phospholipid synthase [Pelagibacterium montanilacus]|uniref:cyclopropane fatty acyl phospholipid synthase n=1 Tax=Pelagibacterium montanilacus TaxID=2185280 RepID=UPI000F8E28BE|nr:cyclopropane fatty acyl phospholipid synthase [Pelagibacterium montanilacus]
MNRYFAPPKRPSAARTSNAERHIADLLGLADIKIGGSRPWDITVNDPRVYQRVLARGSLGLGESYMDGWWGAPAVDELMTKLLEADIPSHLRRDFPLLISIARGRLFNFQRSRAFEVGENHYDIGNDLYQRMLDSRMIYSCAYWKNASTLEEAQERKLDLICRKLDLHPGMKLLDIGSGWGGLLRFAAERYGVQGVGVTVSHEQARYANANRRGLPIETKLIDYMDLEGKFDRIVSVGMFEHVGQKNYGSYFEKVRQLLVPDGLFLLHTIGGNHSSVHGDPWVEKYIFPNGMLPSPAQITRRIEGVFVLEDWHNFGPDYDNTLMAWLSRFDAAWDDLASRYDERFRRMWRYYLMMCAAVFRARHTQLWQVVLSPKGIAGGYKSIR